MSATAATTISSNTRVWIVGIMSCRFRKLNPGVSMVQPAQDPLRDYVSEPLDRASGG